MLWKDNREEVSEGLYALSCRPDLRVRLWASCSVNGVRYNTTDRERHRQTQNSGVLVDGTHNGVPTEFYGQLKEIVELSYNSDLEFIRTLYFFGVSGSVKMAKLEPLEMMVISDQSILRGFGTSQIHSY